MKNLRSNQAQPCIYRSLSSANFLFNKLFFQLSVDPFFLLSNIKVGKIIHETILHNGKFLFK